MTNVLQDFWAPFFLVPVCVATFIIGGRVLAKFFAKPTLGQMAVTEEASRLLLEAQPKCICGELATEPAPVLLRSRGTFDWFRSIFAAPPRYKRVVNEQHVPVFCKAHVHVADAMLDQFIFNRIRGSYADLNAKVAAEAAGFEQEALLRQISDSLTETQKKATRKSSVLRVLPLPKTGTDEAIDA